MRYVALIVAMLCVVVVAMGFAADSKGGLDPNGDYRVKLWRPTLPNTKIEFNAYYSNGYALTTGSLLKGSQIHVYDNRLEIRTAGGLFVYNGVYWISPVTSKSLQLP